MITNTGWDGPKDATDILFEAASGEPSLVVGQVAKDCAALWIRIRGRRFGSHKKRKDCGVKIETSKTGTFKNQRLLQKGALDSQSKRRRTWLQGGVHATDCHSESTAPGQALAAWQKA